MPQVQPLFHSLMRGGSKGLEFAFALLSLDGQVIGRVEGIDRHDDSPFVEHHYRLAIDRCMGESCTRTRRVSSSSTSKGVCWLGSNSKPSP